MDDTFLSFNGAVLLLLLAFVSGVLFTAACAWVWIGGAL